MSFGEGSSSHVTNQEFEEEDGNCETDDSGAEDANDSSEEHGDDANEEVETDEDFYESDYEVAEGDDDLFDNNVDKDVDDHREKEIVQDFEGELPEDALDDSHLNLSKEEGDKLRHKFSTFNPSTDLKAPDFKVGMIFGDMKELRLVVVAYSHLYRQGGRGEEMTPAFCPPRLDPRRPRTNRRRWRRRRGRVYRIRDFLF